MPTQRYFVTSLVLLAGLITMPAHAADTKYNVLFLAVDDLRPELSCYGNQQVKTPNIDRLVNSGVRFDRAYCQFPLCNPSRTSLLTGRHPSTTGVMDNLTWFRAAHPGFVSLPQHFKANGYAALRTGKIFHGGIDDAEAWTAGGEPRDFTGAQRPRPANQAQQQRVQSDRIVVLSGEGETHGDYKTATRAIELLEKHKDQPFFLAVGFVKPHSPPTAPQKFFDLYDSAKIPLPPDFAPRPTLPAGFPAASVPMRNGDLFIERDASEEEARKVIHAYHASLTFMDAQAGRVLEALDRLKLRDKTIIVFFGDHGYHLGEKGKWSKHNSVFEVAARVPLAVLLPGAAGDGKASGRTVQLLDIFPTLVELCALPSPEGLEGHSLAPLLRDPQGSWAHPAFTVCRNNNALGQSVRTERWRYSRWDGGKSGEVLFDHQTDPHETKNLAGNAQHAATVAELRKLLDARFANGD